MTLPMDIRERWIANLQAAGINPATDVLERVAASVEERQTAHREMLERVDCRSSNPDYLRETSEVEPADGDI